MVDWHPGYMQRVMGQKNGYVRWHSRLDCAAMMRADRIIESRVYIEEGGQEHLYSLATGLTYKTDQCDWCRRLDEQ